MKCMARTFIFCLCLFTADASMALSWLVESVPQAAAQGGRAFGKAQLKMVEQVRRAIAQNPTWALSKDFTQTLNLLRKAGVVLPLQPIPSASTAAKETYLKELNQKLFQSAKSLSEQTNQKIRPLIAQEHFNWKPRNTKEFLNLSPDEMDILLQGKSPEISFGTKNWDEFRIKPFSFPAKRGVSSDIYEEIIQKLSAFDGAEYKMFDYILRTPSLNSYQKQLLISALDDAHSLLGSEAVSLYMLLFGQIPKVEFISERGISVNKRMEKYAIYLQKNLINKLERKGSWSETDLDMFVDVSVYLDPVKAQAVLHVLTYLEPSAAIWVLENPLENATSQQILALAKKTSAEKEKIWPDGNLLPKIKTQLDWELLYKERKEALSAQADLLWERMESLWERYSVIKNVMELMNAEPFTPERIPVSISYSTQKVRIEKILKEIKIRLASIQQEIDALSAE